jgi:two-component system chemotaxis response regulator CheB
MPPIFTKQLADRLNQQSSLTVREGQAGDVLLPGTVTIAPGDFHMVLERKAGQVAIGLNKGTPENSCRPAVDVMFRSVAQLYGPNVLAVVLTGMGQDGMRGSGVVRDMGGRVLVQDEATSVVWGMPGSVAGAGLADRVIPLNYIAEEIVKECNSCRDVRTVQKVGT